MILFYLTAKSAKGRERNERKKLCLPGVSFVSQDIPPPLPHPSDPSDSPVTIDAFKSLICPKTNPRPSHIRPIRLIRPIRPIPPDTTDPFESLICPRTNPRRHAGFFATRHPVSKYSAQTTQKRPASRLGDFKQYDRLPQYCVSPLRYSIFSTQT